MLVRNEVHHLRGRNGVHVVEGPSKLAMVGGILGLLWVVLFLIVAIFLQGDIPMRDDPVDEIRAHWVDDGDTYLVGDYLLGVAFMIGFLPFLIVLTRILAAGRGWSELLARIALFAGVIALLFGAVAGFAWGALALGADGFEDSTIVMLMEMDAYAFSGLLFPVGLFLGAAGLSIWLSGILWRWLGIIGIIGFVGSYIGAAWPIDGDEEGAVATVGIIGFVGLMLFVLIASIGLLRLRTEPAPEHLAS